MDIGFHRAGFEIVACVEIEKIFSQTLDTNKSRYLSAQCQILNRDIRYLDPDEIQVSKIDFIIGGPPCQSFSAIGRRAGGVVGIRDIRGGLFEHYCRMLDHYKPAGFLFENVRGILGSNKGKDWQRIVEAFASLGYKLSYRVLDTADYGVPQHRERLILVGTRDQAFEFPRPSHGPNSRDGVSYISASDAIAWLQDPDEPYQHYDGKYGHLLEEVPPGQNYHYFTREMGHPNPVFAWRSRFSDFLYKADPDQPVRTIVAQLGKYSGPFHWKNRRFTLAEFKRLQTFPDDYEFVGGFNRAIQQLGNSVPPLFGYQLARAVMQQIFHADLGVELIDETHKLAFDGRKSRKAKKTRHKRTVVTNGSLPPLLALLEQNTIDVVRPSEINETHIYSYLYLDPKRRISLAEEDSKNVGGERYDFVVNRIGDFCAITISHCSRDEVAQPLLRYELSFQEPIGNGLRYIHCTLNSNLGTDVAVAWDAIEDYIGTISGYQSMMDIYGHFTEPHPIFTLRMYVLTETPSFPVAVAKRFSDFAETVKVLPEQDLAELFTTFYTEDFTLSSVAWSLRQLRFDIRVHETNRTIPPQHFRCCYPFTINIGKQISIRWRVKESEEDMVSNSEYGRHLEQAFAQATQLLATPDWAKTLSEFMRHPSLSHQLKAQTAQGIILQGRTVAQGIETIVTNLKHSRYIYSVLITALVEKLVHPEQDIRIIQKNMNGGYSNRTVDQTHVTPFLKRRSLTHMATSGLESGRNLERPFAHDLSFPAKTRGAGTIPSYLGILHAVEEEGVDPFPCIVLLVTLDLAQQEEVIYDYPEIAGLTIQEITDTLKEYFAEARGNGKSRLPVLAIHAVYQSLVAELARFEGMRLLTPNRHTANDKLGWVGDVQINNEIDLAFEAIEVKSDKPIDSSMILALPRKLQGHVVDRYYILSTNEAYIAEGQEESIRAAIADVRKKTGCEVIVNGLFRSLWYYLRLITDKDKFLENFTNLIVIDMDVQPTHRELWSRMLVEIGKRQET